MVSLVPAAPAPSRPACAMHMPGAQGSARGGRGAQAARTSVV